MSKAVMVVGPKSYPHYGHYGLIAMMGSQDAMTKGIQPALPVGWIQIFLGLGGTHLSNWGASLFSWDNGIAW